MEKLIKLRAEVLQVEEEVRVKVKQAGFLCDLQETAPSGSSVMCTPPSPRASSIMVTPTSRKRSRSHSPVNSPVAKRRAVFVNTLVQLFMSNVVPSATSPAVAVSRSILVAWVAIVVVLLCRLLQVDHHKIQH